MTHEIFARPYHRGNVRLLVPGKRRNAGLPPVGRQEVLRDIFILMSGQAHLTITPEPPEKQVEERE